MQTIECAFTGRLGDTQDEAYELGLPQIEDCLRILAGEPVTGATINERVEQ
jgi:hypothetical protein